MEFDFSPNVVGITVVIWAVVLIALWKMTIGSEVDVTFYKIVFSILSGPVIYLIVNHAANK